MFKPRVLLFLCIISVLFSSCSDDSDQSKKEKDANNASSKGDAMFPYYKRKKILTGNLGARYGYMNKDGKRVTKSIFYEAHTFTDGLGCVSVAKNRELRYGYINKSGDYTIDPRYKKARPFREGRALVCNDSSDWFVIDKKGNPLTKAKYSGVSSDYINGYCYAYEFKRKEEKRGFLGGRKTTTYYDLYKIDRSGKATLLASETTNTDYRDSSRLAIMDHLGMFWINDANGNRSYGFKKISFDEFNQTPLSECGNYRTEGTEQIKPTFQGAECFEGGYARVTLNSGKTAYIDTKGTVLFTFQDGR